MPQFIIGFVVRYPVNTDNGKIYPLNHPVKELFVVFKLLFNFVKKYRALCFSRKRARTPEFIPSIGVEAGNNDNNCASRLQGS